MELYSKNELYKNICWVPLIVHARFSQPKDKAQVSKTFEMKLLEFLDRFDKFTRIVVTDLEMYMYKENCLSNCSGNSAQFSSLGMNKFLAMGGNLPNLNQIAKFEANDTYCHKSEAIPGGIHCSGK